MNRTLEHHFKSFSDKKYIEYTDSLGRDMSAIEALDYKASFLLSQEKLDLLEYLISFVRNVGRMAEEENYGPMKPQLDKLYVFEERWTKVRDAALFGLRDKDRLGELSKYGYFIEQFFRMKASDEVCAETIAAMYSGLEKYQDEISINRDGVICSRSFARLYSSGSKNDIIENLKALADIDNSAFSDIILEMKRRQKENASRLGYSNVRHFVDDNYQISHSVVDYIGSLVGRMMKDNRKSQVEILESMFLGCRDEMERFSIDEAFELVRECFATVIPGMADMTETARTECWVDWERRDGKLGGSYTNILHYVGESIISLTFDGSVRDLCKLAHELGHAYHGRILSEVDYFNADFSVICAESFGLFCEYYFLKFMWKKTHDERYGEMLKEAVLNTWYTNAYHYRFEENLFASLSEDNEDVSACCGSAAEQVVGSGASDNFEGLKNVWISRSQNFFPVYFFYNIVYMIGEYYALWMMDALECGAVGAKNIEMMLAESGRKAVDQLFAEMGVKYDESETVKFLDYFA